MSFLNSVIKDLGNEYAAVVTDGIAAGDTASFVDTGSYIFNALVSGSTVSYTHLTLPTKQAV